MEQMKNKNGFLITCVSCIVLLLTLCYFGISTGAKGTYSVASCASDEVELDGYCCPFGSTYVINGQYCDVVDTDFYEFIFVNSQKKCVTYRPDGNCPVNHTQGAEYGTIAVYNCKNSSGVIVEENVITCSNSSLTAEKTGSVKAYQCIANDYSACLATAQKIDSTSTTGACYMVKSTGKVIWSTTVLSSTTHTNISSSYPTQFSCLAADKSSVTNSNNGCIYTKINDNNYNSYYTGTDSSCCPSAGASYNSSTNVCTVNELTFSNGGGTYYYWPFDSCKSGYTKTENSLNFCLKCNSGYVATGANCAAVTKYTVTYNANGGSGAPSVQEFNAGESVTLSSTVPTRVGYRFIGWNTKADGSGGTYVKANTYTFNESITLYAEWKILETYAISYNSNATSGFDISSLPLAQLKTQDVDLTLSSNKPTRTGYLFTGWNTSADGSGTSYAPGSTYTKNAPVTLYAQWTANSSGGTTTETKTCVYSSGVYSWKVAGASDVVVNVTESACLAKNSNVCIKGTNSNKWGVASPSDQVLLDLDTQVKCLGIKYTEYYTVKYNLDGGVFPNGDETRTVVINNVDLKLNQPAVNPVKDGYRFVGWYDGNTKFTGFGKVINNDYELTAHYEKITDTKCSYTCNSNDVYDPSIKKCISLDINGKSFGVLTNEIKIELSCVNSVASGTGNSNTNSLTCLDGYTKEYWLSSDTCKLGGACVNTGDECVRSFKGICYKTYDATEKCSTNTTDSEGNTNKNPQTGSIVIALVWFFGLAAVGYSFYYFKSLKQN